VSGSQSTGKHSLNSTVFSSSRKATKVDAFLTRVGREFQALAAAAGKAQSPDVERRVDGTRETLGFDNNICYDNARSNSELFTF